MKIFVVTVAQSFPILGDSKDSSRGVFGAPLSIGFPKQECWHGLPFPSPRDLPDPRIKPVSPVLALGFLAAAPPGKLPT